MTLVLCILDGWGTGLETEYNAIYKANPSFWYYLLSKYPNSQLVTSGEEIGLPKGQIGNSEVGHMTIGSGRIIYHDLIRLKLAIKNLEGNINFTNFINSILEKNAALHIVGLLSDGGVHSHICHITSVLKYLKERYKLPIYLHAFLDGRDTPPTSALNYIDDLLPLATITGRYYAMDRDNRWERTKAATDAIIKGKGEKFLSPTECINFNYKFGITDEFIEPSIIGNYNGYHTNDGILLLNFRADRVRQLLNSLLNDYGLGHFPILGAINYGEDYPIPSILDIVKVNNTLGELLQKNGLTQLRIAETEKYAHVTFFFNANKEKAFENEERILIPSPKVATYNLFPEMSAKLITQTLVRAINEKKFDFILINYANADMVGHSGDINATIKAIKVLDNCLVDLYEVSKKNNSILLITSDHGNAECMYNEHLDVPHTAHTLNTVPFIIVKPKGVSVKVRDGNLADIAPTILELLNLPKPIEMSGNSLLI